MQIMSALIHGKGWVNHPATKMWRGYEWALLQYQFAVCSEWMKRGYKDTCYGKTFHLYHDYRDDDPHRYVFPEWLGREDFHLSHRSNLVRKDPMYYLPLFGDVPPDLDYVWPIPHLGNRGYLMPVADTLVLQDARLIFRNFAGAEKQFNSEGDRNFCVELSSEQAARLREDGWNVKATRPRDEDDEPTHYLQVTVQYDKGRPPRVVLITSQGRTELGAAEVGMIDFADIKMADVAINPYKWEIKKGDNVDSGVKAYLKHAFITLNEDELELKYAQLPEDPTKMSSNSIASED